MLLMLVFVPVLTAGAQDIGALLDTLDVALAEAGKYADVRKNEIAGLKKNWSMPPQMRNVTG